MIQELLRACSIRPLYDGLDPQFQCLRSSWSEQTLRSNDEMQAVLRKACKKHAFILRTTFYTYPIPFLIKQRGMWTMFDPHLIDPARSISKVCEMPMGQLHFGVSPLAPCFYNRIDIKGLAMQGPFYIITTDTTRQASSYLETCFTNTGEFDIKCALKSTFSESDALIIVKDYSEDFVIDQLYIQPQSIM